jgi:hypothetical protein
VKSNYLKTIDGGSGKNKKKIVPFFKDG